MNAVHQNFCFGKGEREEKTRRERDGGERRARRWEQSAQHLERVRVLRNRPPRTDRHTYTRRTQQRAWGKARSFERGTQRPQGSGGECEGEEGRVWRKRGNFRRSTAHHPKTRAERGIPTCTRYALVSQCEPPTIPGLKRTRNRASIHIANKARDVQRADLYARAAYTSDSAMYRSILRLSAPAIHLPWWIPPRRELALFSATGVQGIVRFASSGPPASRDSRSVFSKCFELGDVKIDARATTSVFVFLLHFLFLRIFCIPVKYTGNFSFLRHILDFPS